LNIINIGVEVGVEVGIEGDFSNVHHADFVNVPVGCGTRNFRREQAMSLGELAQAMEIGRAQARQAKEAHIELLGIGEMGIGNTTSASALVSALLDVSPEDAVGRGTGLDDAGVKHKAHVVREAIEFHKPNCPNALAWLQAVGGFEIAAMCGTILEAWNLRLPIVIDGFVATAAAVVAFQIEPKAKDVCFFAHCSAEKAHALVLERLGVTPMLSLGMRLGEGTGAALAMPMLDAAAKLLCDMATFDSAGVSESSRL
jgi:nicotinate-nucleotide--dimethylbenzimidazole phosphoribosyltransferase